MASKEATNLVKLLLLISCGVAVIDCYSSGAPTTICTTMMPGHGSQQNGSQYTIEVGGDVTTYKPGGSQIQVTVSGSMPFAGMLLQARNVGDTTPLGSFASPDASTNTKLIKCTSEGDSVTHSSKETKSNLTFMWTPPSMATGDIEFVATVAESKNVWWMNVKSDAIKKAGGEDKDKDKDKNKDKDKDKGKGKDNSAENVALNSALAVTCLFLAAFRM